MQSIRRKLLILMCGIIFCTYTFIAGAASYAFKILLEKKNAQTMNMIAREKANELNVHMQRIESSLIVLEKFISENIDLQLFKNDKEYSKKFINEFETLARSAAVVTGNVTAVYFRPEANEYGSTNGFLLSKSKYGEFNSITPTDILKYPSTDREHVAWYYEPKKIGTPVWLAPYNNRNLNYYMISYVIPLYSHGKFYGIIGMDMNMAAIHWVVDSINYENGFGLLLTKKGSIVYHKDFPEGKSLVHFNEELLTISEYLVENSNKDEIGMCNWHHHKYYFTGASIQNGMILAISAPADNVLLQYHKLRSYMVIVLVCVIIAILIALRLVMRHVILPIGELTRAAARIAKGELNTPILYKSDDEIGKLSDSLRKMASELQEYINYISKQAYTDAMTGVGNQAAYIDFTKKLDRKINEGLARFVVIMFDVNGLKTTNDTLGHEYGDALIKSAAQVIKSTFGQENIYRIGGDEFIAIIENTSEKEIEKLFAQYKTNLETENKKASESNPAASELSISHGYAFYTSEKQYKDVFQLADEDMYREKEKFYQGKKDRRRR